MDLVRFRLDLTPECSVGPGKIDLLEAIARTGSLRQAARELSMSYRRAWLLLDAINRGFAERVTIAKLGGAGGGGAELTPFGKDLVSSYREVAAAMQKLAADRLSRFMEQAVGRPARKRTAKRAASTGAAARRRRLVKPVAR